MNNVPMADITPAITNDELRQLEDKVEAAAKTDGEEAAWEALQPLLKTQKDQLEVAVSAVKLVDRGLFSIEHACQVLTNVFDAHSDHTWLVGKIGYALEAARDIDELNSAPPDEAVFVDVINAINRMLGETDNPDMEENLLTGLAVATRMMGRQYDELAYKSANNLTDISPYDHAHFYRLGLLCKTRGYFQDGMLANQTAASLVKEPTEAMRWNLGICATGAGEGEVALEVWKGIGNKIEMGRFDLPDGGYPMCKVKLAERPLAERSKDTDDPGKEETIWIERLSPCHGIVRSVLYYDLGVDYGDVVLIDGAPITYHQYDDEKVPVFPHLATLRHFNYQLYNFAGTQEQAGQLGDLSKGLEDDAVVYSHTEQFRRLCRSCWQNADTAHNHDEQEEHHVVHGQIAAPPNLEAAALLQQLDAAVQAQGACEIYAPTLCRAAGDEARADVERRRYDMLANSLSH